MLYLLIMIAGIALSIGAYRQSQRKIEVDPMSPFKRGIQFFASYTASITFAIIPLIAVVLKTLTANPGPRQIQKIHEKRERHAVYSVGHVLGHKFSYYAPPKSKAMIINRINNRHDEEYHRAVMSGFREGIFRNIESVVEELITADDSENGDAADQLYDREFEAATLDDILEEHEDVIVIISMIGVPERYRSSRAWLRVNSGELLFGVFTDDIYELGAMIFERDITACVAPISLFAYDYDYFYAENIEQQFQKRYHYIDTHNIIELSKLFPRMFKISKHG